LNIRLTIAVEFDISRGEAGNGRLNGEEELKGRQQAAGQRPSAKSLKPQLVVGGEPTGTPVPTSAVGVGSGDGVGAAISCAGVGTGAGAGVGAGAGAGVGAGAGAEAGSELGLFFPPALRVSSTSCELEVAAETRTAPRSTPLRTAATFRGRWFRGVCSRAATTPSGWTPLTTNLAMLAETFWAGNTCFWAASAMTLETSRKASARAVPALTRTLTESFVRG
jgi:hypothetical protein